MPSLSKYRAAAFNQQNGLCYYCGLPMWLKKPSAFAAALGISAKEASELRCTAEHLTAKQDGGRNSRANIVAACHRCNATRHRKPVPLDPNEYHQYVQRRMRAGRWFGNNLAARLAETLKRRQNTGALLSVGVRRSSAMIGERASHITD